MTYRVRGALVKPCRRGFQFLFSEHQIGFFKSGALHIHKNTCISCRKGNIADVGSMREYDMHMHCMSIMSYSLIHFGILRTFPDLLDMPGGALMRHIATLWVGRVEAWRIMKVGLVRLSNCPSGPSGPCFFFECRVHSQIFRQVICTIPRLTALLKQAWVSHSASIPRDFAIVGDVGVVDVF